MTFETTPKTERIMTAAEITEAVNRMKSIPEKVKLLENQMRAIDEEGSQNNNSEKHAQLGELYNQFEIMKKSLLEAITVSKSENPELVPTLTGDAEMDDVLRAQLIPEQTKEDNAPISKSEPIPSFGLVADPSAPQVVVTENLGEANPSIKLVPDEPTGPVVVPTPDVTSAEQVVVAQGNTAVTAAAEHAPSTTEPNHPETPEEPKSPEQNNLQSQAEIIAQKIKNGDPLSKDDLEFRTNNWSILERAMMQNVTKAETTPGVTSEQILEQNSTPVENISRNLEQSRSDYVAAFQKNRVNPGSIDHARLLELKNIYDENTKKGIDEIWSQTKDKKLLIDSLRDERRALEKEILERDTAETKARIEKSLKKFELVAGSVLLYSLLLTGKFINDALELGKKGIEKLQSGNGKALELLKKHYDTMKASAKAPDPKAKFMDQFINPLNKLWGGETGKRSFEQGTKEQQEATAKVATLEKKKVDNGAKEKTPEELEKSQMKDFLKKSFESGFEGKQMTTKEEKDTLRAWNKIKDKPVHLFMNPEKVVYKNAQGEEVTKKVSDYSKAEQGLYKKIKDAYTDRQVSTPMGDGMTLEQFIKESIKNGSIK